VVVEIAAGKVRELLTLRGDRRRAFLVRKLHDGIGVGDVKIIADQRHAERRVQSRQELGLHLRDAVAVGITQQGDAIGRRHYRARLLHVLLHEGAADSLAVLGSFGCGGFGDQHVAVRQRVHPARVLQAAGKRVDLYARGCGGFHAGRPPPGLGDLHHRNGFLFFRGRQSRIGADRRLR
jgi:hypothetical protein